MEAALGLNAHVTSMKVFRAPGETLSNPFVSSSEIRHGCSLREAVLRSSPSTLGNFTAQPQRQQLTRTPKSARGGRTGARAMLLEPTDLSAKSLFEFGKLAEDLNFEQNPPQVVLSSTSSSNSRGDGKPLMEQMDMNSIFSGSVGEALTSHAKLQKSRSLEENKRMQREMIPLHTLRQGGFVEDSLMYRQIFVIRSYEVGADRTTSIQTMFSLFQEMALCHVHLLGVSGDGFGATRAMNPLGLIWVVTRMHVEVERYPCWTEVVEIDTWVARAGRNGMRRDWVMRCYQTGEVLARATSSWCMMHSKTRRLAKFPDVVRDEINFTFINDRFAIPPTRENIKIGKLNNNTAEFVNSDLKPSREDLDLNQHVSNLKYVSWVFESIPVEYFQKHELKSMTLEYRRECHSNDVVESLGSPMKVCKSDNQVETIAQVNNNNGTVITHCDRHADQDSGQLISSSNHVASGSSMKNHSNGSCCSSSSSSATALNSSLQPVKKETIAAGSDAEDHSYSQFIHLLRLQGAENEILRGRTVWRPRSSS